MFTPRARLLAIASLLLTCMIVDIAAAQKPRSAADRRQRPNAGFWDNSSSSRSSSSRSTWSNPMSFSAPRAYASQGSVTTGNYTISSKRYLPGTIVAAPSPQYSVAPDSVVPGQTAISSSPVPSNPGAARTIVLQPVPPQTQD